ncbi:hypothetical protein [Cohnella zeiphila]|uniref:Uncharacterized protein n=1 Tax=Cohnella zeiphila TaxID=2761120 RepID=A0A7X0SQW8_9BACL|nr:hypothetical protein [Cohnella zeiphila]MBB6734404.1 hypothetical protein [Cohnella zeiphila]
MARNEYPRPQFKRKNWINLNGGAVDYAATVGVNGRKVGEHEGGHVPFSFQKIEERDFNHPCIVAWVSHNESRGVPNVLRNEQEQQFGQPKVPLERTKRMLEGLS